MRSNIKYIVFAFLSLVVISSCKSALDKDPLTEYSSDNFWNEPAQASAALNGAYFRLQSTLNTEFIYYGEGRADNLILALENNTQSIALINNRLDPSLAFTDWGGFYRVINQANVVIRNVKDMNERGRYLNQTTEYNRVLGQALGLRAMCYFYMTRIWGNVPLITEPTDYTGDFNTFKSPRTDTMEVFKQISTDLVQARPLLPVSYSRPEQTRATLTRGAIDAILTDYYMWRSNIDSAIITSKRILDNTTQYRLATLSNPNVDYFSQSQTSIDNTEYARMFTEGFSQESIFEIAYSYEENTTSGLLTLFAGGSGQAQFFASSDLTSKFSLTDLRRLVNFKSENQVFKNFPKGTFDRTTDNDKNVILYRLADIMLLRAEALNSKGDKAGAFALLNEIRKRAGLTLIPANDVIDLNTGLVSTKGYNSYSPAEAKDAILEERQKELCFEGKRWYDLVRNGIAISTMGPINGLTNPENILWPINLNIIRQNSLIEQNNFYK